MCTFFYCIVSELSVCTCQLSFYVPYCHRTLRFICRSLQEQVVAKWPLDDSVRIRAVSGFLFLRFVCPALLKPQLFDLISGE